MFKTVRRLSLVAVTLIAAAVLTAGPALAGHCMNANKNQQAGVQAVLDLNTFQIVFVSNGLQHRIDQGLVDLNTGEGFSGLIGFDLDSDGVADVTTFIVGPTFAIPEQAQTNGAACHGIISIEAFFTECVA
jgi:hypothetical protein